MTHRASDDDTRFRTAFEALALPPAEFDHGAHVRLAYIYLCEGTVDDAVDTMKRSLLAFIAHVGADPVKFHETITRAWVMAVDYFMGRTPPCASYAEFVGLNPKLLDSRIMLTHYSAELLFSPAARQRFIAPDIQPIPPE